MKTICSKCGYYCEKDRTQRVDRAVCLKCKRYLGKINGKKWREKQKKGRLGK